eukprot:1143664-Pelagomonas_calceolata.AAC.3
MSKRNPQEATPGFTDQQQWFGTYPGPKSGGAEGLGWGSRKSPNFGRGKLKVMGGAVGVGMQYHLNLRP